MPANSPDSSSSESPAAPKSQVVSSGGKRGDFSPDKIKSQDFRQSAFLAPSELRRIRQREEQFVRSLAARLSIYLRMEFTSQVSKLHVISFQKFTESLPAPNHIILFKMEPLKGVGLLVMPPKLGLTIVDRLLGGPGTPPKNLGDLSDIERALLDQVVQIVLKEWCFHWQDIEDIQPSLLGHENNGKFLQTSPADAAMLVLSVEAGLGDCVDQMQIALPYYMIEPLVRRLAPGGLPENEPPGAAPAKVKWNPQLNDIKIPVKANWSDVKMTVREISTLKPGDLIALDPEVLNQVVVTFSESPRFKGRLGTYGSQWAVELTEKVGSK